MIKKYLKQFIILNFILAILAFVPAFPYSYTAGPEYMLFIFILAGLISGFIFKENRLLGYSAHMCINSIVFTFLYLAVMGIYLYRSWADHGIFEMMIPAMLVFPIISFFVFVGSLIAIIPKAIAERIYPKSVLKSNLWS